MSEELNNNVTEETATAAPAAEEAPVESKAKTKFGRKLDNYFGITKEKSTFGTEIVAGIVTFLAMAYILVVNPNAISLFGVNKVPTEQLFLATALGAAIGTLLMAFVAKMPLAQASGMGLNYTVGGLIAGGLAGAAVTFGNAMLLVLISGIIFLLLSVIKINGVAIREVIFDGIPECVRGAIAVGIGLFIAFIGLQGANLVVNDDSTLLTYVKFVGDFHTIGIGALLALIGLFIIVVLHHKNIKGSILIGILATWILGMICEAIGLYVPDGKDFYSLYPTFRMIDFGAFGTTFGQCFNVDFSGVDILNFIAVLFAFLFVDIFDTLGTLIGVSTKANMLDEEGKLPRIRPALLADAIATSVGAIFGTSTTTTYVESSAGVAAGGRTGLSAMVTGLLFLLAIVFAPIFTAIPSFATAPALIFVGFLMISSIISIDFEDITEAVPAYLAMLAMPLMYSISEGIALGVISYVVINLCCGKAKKIKPLMYILTVLFVLKYIFL